MMNKRLGIALLVILFACLSTNAQVQLTENFDSGNSIPTSSSNAPSTPTDYSTSSGTWNLFKSYRHGTANYSAPYALRLLKNTVEAPAFAITPALNSAGTISFWGYGSAAKPIYVYKSTDNGSNWTFVDSALTGSGTFVYCSVTVNDGSSNLKLKIVNGTGAGNDLNFDNVEITSYSSASTISVSANSLAGFGPVISGNNSTSSSYSVRAYNLTANLLISAPTGFGVSLDNAAFSNSLSIPASGGAVNNTTVYVRFSPTTPDGTLNGNITNASAGAVTQNVAVSGIAIASEPSLQSNISFGAVTGYTIVVNTSGGNGMKRIIVARQGGATSWVPSDGNNIPSGVNSDFSAAQDLGGGNKVIYNGSGNSVTVSGLNGSTTYYFAVFEYNEGTNNSQNYNIISPGTGNQTTLSVPTLTVNPATLVFGNVQIGTTSVEKTYILSGNTLSPSSGNINVTSPAGYEISLTSGGGFGASLNIPYSGSVLATTTIFVRFKPTTVSPYSASITHQGGNASVVSVTVSGNGITPSEPNVLQAEDGILESSYSRQQYNGYTGWGYVDLADKTGSSLEFVFRRETAATDIVTLTYANGGSSRSLSVKLNDAVLGTLNFPSTGSWTTWATVTYSVSMVAGINRLNFSSTTNNTNPNIDKMHIAGQTATPVYKLVLLKSGNGSVSSSSPEVYFDSGTQVTLTATPLSGAVFYRWNGTEVSYGNPLVLTMNSHKIEIALMMDTLGISNFPYEPNPRGFASVPGMGYPNGTTGGVSPENHVVYVSTANELQNVMLRRVDANETLNMPPLTVYIVGILSREAGIGEMLDVKDLYDVSIIGVGKDATITGFGLNITRSKNVIVRNIKFASWSDDGISVDANDDPNEGNHIWIDHCTFTYTPPAGYPAASTPDGSIDITHTASFVTVSFCVFDSTDKNSLVGHSNTNVTDTAMRITYHHNWFKSAIQRNPRVRFAKVHVFNNYYTNNSIYGVSSNLEADVLVEGNYFFNTPIPTETSRDGSPPGDLVQRYNIFVNCGEPGVRGDAFEASNYYYYSLNPATEIPSLIPMLAGSNKYDYSNPTNFIPVELISFKTRVLGSSVRLEWSTASETNNAGFEVQRKEINKDWENLGFVEGAGTSSETRNYMFEDSKLPSGKYSYRLKQIDFNGTASYSAVAEAEINYMPGEFYLSQNYPNPFNPNTTIEFNIGSSSFVTLKVYDVLGNEITALVSENMNSGRYTKNIDAGKLSSGVYYYRLTAGDFTETKKMLLLK